MAALGVDHVIAVLGDVAKIVDDGFAAVQGNIFAKLAAVAAILGDVQKLVVDAPAAWPELQDLDASESALVGEAAYKCIYSIVKKVAGK